MDNFFSKTLTWAQKANLKTASYESIPSTNLSAKESHHLETDLILAQHQTHGRGRGPNDWQTKSGDALLTSWCFHTPTPPQPVFAIRVGMALYRAATETWPNIPFSLKAPNDLHIIEANQPLKLAGLLIEIIQGGPRGATGSGSSITQLSSRIIVGLGLNVLGAPQETTPFKATYLQKHQLSLENWDQFLTTWHSGLLAAVALADQITLTPFEQEMVLQALEKHPLYKKLKAVKEDGSLLDNSGQLTPWFTL